MIDEYITLRIMFEMFKDALAFIAAVVGLVLGLLQILEREEKVKNYLVYVELNGIWTNLLIKATNWEEAEQLAELEVRKVSVEA